MSPVMEVSIRPIQCKIGDASGYTLMLQAGDYGMIALSSAEHTLRLLDADVVEAAIKELATDVQLARDNKCPVHAYIEPMESLSKNKTPHSVIRITVPATAGQHIQTPHELLVAHDEDGRIVPTLFMNVKEAQAHAGEVVDIMSSFTVDWRSMVITDNELKNPVSEKKK